MFATALGHALGWILMGAAWALLTWQLAHSKYDRNTRPELGEWFIHAMSAFIPFAIWAAGQGILISNQAEDARQNPPAIYDSVP
jgi:hypothetical protein